MRDVSVVRDVWYKERMGVRGSLQSISPMGHPHRAAQLPGCSPGIPNQPC